MINSRNERLAADYRDMLKIQNRPYLSWIATKGEPPCAEEYLLTVKVRTYALRAESGIYTVGAIQGCVIRMTLWDSYPHVAPSMKMLSIPPAFHPDWYSKGTYCPSEPWSPDASLKDHVKNMIASLMYDPAFINTSAPANYKALDWYMKNRGSGGLFPSDSVELTENEPDEVEAARKAALGFSEIIDSWSCRG